MITDPWAVSTGLPLFLSSHGLGSASSLQTRNNHPGGCEPTGEKVPGSLNDLKEQSGSQPLEPACLWTVTREIETFVPCKPWCQPSQCPIEYVVIYTRPPLTSETKTTHLMHLTKSNSTVDKVLSLRQEDFSGSLLDSNVCDSVLYFNIPGRKGWVVFRC